ncbi:hypothetical protein CDAR_473711 [Caerostris darwini]|uniref:Uncharacterized protein n=1 Tax=Caerostris darwini TaxID=1538125 RepID=A0AAV4SB77_9ARAC|nr:hypothetical protein CDAR_473711 [Caerostris darwini]
MTLLTIQKIVKNKSKTLIKSALSITVQTLPGRRSIVKDGHIQDSLTVVSFPLLAANPPAKSVRSITVNKTVPVHLVVKRLLSLLRGAALKNRLQMPLPCA